MEVLKPYRARIDALDDQIIDLLAQRLAIIDEVAKIKADRDIPAVIEERVHEVIEHAAKRAGERGVSPELARRIYAVIVAWCCDVEHEYIDAQERSRTAAR